MVGICPKMINCVFQIFIQGRGDGRVKSGISDQAAGNADIFCHQMQEKAGFIAACDNERFQLDLGRVVAAGRSVNDLGKGFRRDAE